MLLASLFFALGPGIPSVACCCKTAASEASTTCCAADVAPACPHCATTANGNASRGDSCSREGGHCPKGDSCHCHDLPVAIVGAIGTKNSGGERSVAEEVPVLPAAGLAACGWDADSVRGVLARSRSAAAVRAGDEICVRLCRWRK
ncbi:MAG: hypothetical protein AAF958_06640 [Planctomycetota bacterium]